MGWRSRPTRVHELSGDIEYVLFIDESGCSEMKNIKKKIDKEEEVAEEDRFFCVTGVLIHRDKFPEISDKIVSLKQKYWPPHGMAEYKGIEKRVCFHSYEIRRSRGVFHPKILKDRAAFMNDLSEFLEEIDVKVFAVVIDKKELYRRYLSAHRQPYDLCMEFILERLCFYNASRGKCAIVLEGRGKEDDRILLKHILKLIDNGTYYISKERFLFIDGVYFNLKWSENHECKKSFFGLEIADLFCHPIIQYGKSGKRTLPFETIEPKIYSFPHYLGKGYKKFP